MAQGRISKRTVDGLQCPPGKDRIFLWDNDLAGFGVAAFPTGKKVYVAQFRQHGRSRRITLGVHGRLTPDQARSEAKKLLGAVETGADPIANRHAARAVRTFEEVAKDFLALHVAPKRKVRTGEGYETLLNRHILKAIGRTRITELRRADIAALHRTIGPEAPGAANRALSLISAIWNFAAKHEEASLADNPCRIERYPEKGRERFLTTHEVAKLKAALAEAETVGLPNAVDETNPNAKHAPKNGRTIINPFAAAAIRLLMLTGARLREILNAKWTELDAERAILFLPDSKTGKKPIYLGKAALEVIAGLPRVEGNPHIIAGRNGGPRADLKLPWAAVTRAAGLDGLRIHDLRHSFASFGAGASLGLPLIGKMLGHSQPQTTARYAHLHADPIHEAVELIHARMDGAGASDVVANDKGDKSKRS